MDFKKIKDYAAFVVFAHIVIAGFDYLAHQRVDLKFSLSENVITFCVVATPPLIAGAMLLTRIQKAGAILLFTTMALAFIYNSYLSFVSPHKVLLTSGASPLWESAFFVSSSFLLISEVIGCWIAIKALRVLKASEMKSSSESKP